MTRLTKETGRPVWFLLTDRYEDPMRWRRLLASFFFQAEDGIRDDLVTGVQTCALPIYAFGRRSTRVGSIDVDGHQSSVGIDDHCHCCRDRDRPIVNIVDIAPVTFLAKNSVHTRVVADDDIIIGGGNTRPGLTAYAHVVACRLAVHERHITDGRVAVPAGVGSERFPTDARVGTARGIVHESKITGGRVGGTAVVKDERVGPKGRVV